MRKPHLSEEYALVLQQIDESGEEDFTTLAEMLRFDRQRLAHIVQALHHKGLIVVHRSRQYDPWLRVSAKGRQLMDALWPEIQARPTYA
jgi:DNA-binding MarR family transcriptional regulator